MTDDADRAEAENMGGTSAENADRPEAEHAARATAERLVKSPALALMVPGLSPCCLLGLPIGIWAAVVLNKAEVKSAFT
jgi:hypothetical protein